MDALVLALLLFWCGDICRAEPEMEGLLCDLLWADPSDDPGVTNIESLSDQVRGVVHGRNAWQA